MDDLSGPPGNGDLRARVGWQEAAPPLTHERYTLSTGGASYGIELAADRTGTRRPAPRTPVGAPYLAPASARRGHGIVGALAGGRDAACEVRDRDITSEVRWRAAFADVEGLAARGPDLAARRRLQDKARRTSRKPVAA